MMTCRSDVFAAIRERVALCDVIAACGIDTGRRGHSICCPLHSDKTPSFRIYDGDNRFHCFGCQAHGDAVDFIEQYYGMTTKAALGWIGTTFGIDTETNVVPDAAVMSKINRRREAEKKLSVWSDLQYAEICDALKLLERWKALYKPPDARAFMWMNNTDRLEYYAELFLHDENTNQLFTERADINGIIDEIRRADRGTDRRSTG